jgi:hypothetical protein
MFLFNKKNYTNDFDLCFVKNARSNKSKYESNLRRCNSKLEEDDLSQEERLNNLIEKGNTLLRLIPTRSSEKEKGRYLKYAEKIYRQAEKLCFDSKTKTNLVRAINQIEEKQKNIFKYNFKNDSFLIFILASFIIALFFLSINLTGAVTGTAKSDFSILGILFFIAGLITAFIYFRSKR